MLVILVCCSEWGYSAGWLTSPALSQAAILCLLQPSIGGHRRHDPVDWQIPGAKSSRKSAAQAEQERKDRLWRLEAAKIAGKGYLGWQGHHCRNAYRDLEACISAVDQRLMGK